MRLSRYLSHRGIASRREVERLIELGKIKVNTVLITDKGRKVDPAVDVIEVNGQLIPHAVEEGYWLLNKPVDVLSTTKDPEGRETVVGIFKKKFPLLPGDSGITQRKIPEVYPVGRLDRDSRGLVLLTNDGELAHRIIHPRYHVPKVYMVTVWGDLSDLKLKRLRTGVKLTDGMTKPVDVEVIGDSSGKRRMLRMTLYEGKHRQIRRMCGVLNLEVKDLQRVAIGPLELGDLKERWVRSLTQDEVRKLRELLS